MNKIIIGIVVVLIAGGVYLFVSPNKDDVNVSGPYDGWETYRDSTYKFEMKYPPEWTPRFIEGQFAGFYDVSYEDWLVDFDEAIRVSGPGVIDFAVRKERVLEEEGVELTLEDYAYRFYKRTDPNSGVEPIVAVLTIADGREVTRIESYSTITNPEGVYVSVYVPTSDNRVYIFTTIETYSYNFDQMISTFQMTK